MSEINVDEVIKGAQKDFDLRAELTASYGTPGAETNVGKPHTI